MWHQPILVVDGIVLWRINFALEQLQEVQETVTAVRIVNGPIEMETLLVQACKVVKILTED